MKTSAEPAILRTDEFPACRHEQPLPVIHQELEAIWCKVLQLDHVGIDQDFFELGGDSLSAVLIMDEIRERYAVDLGLAVLYRAPTIASLAARLQTKEEKVWSPLVAVQPHGSKPPLFFIHALGGNVLGYSEFAAHLDEDQPFYAVQAFGTLNGQTPHDSIEEMASIYLRSIREIQPVGPYNLGGHSFGGVVAFEMARQLESEGEKVASLIVGDFWFVRGAHYRRWRYILSALTFVFSISPYRWLSLLRYRLSRSRRAKIKRYTVSDAIHDDLKNAHRLAASRYYPTPCAGKVTLIRAGLFGSKVQRLQHYFRGPLMGWDKLARGGVELHFVDDSHREIIHGKNARRFADILGDCLRRAQRPETLRTAGAGARAEPSRIQNGAGCTEPA